MSQQIEIGQQVEIRLTEAFKSKIAARGISEAEAIKNGFLQFVGLKGVVVSIDEDGIGVNLETKGVRYFSVDDITQEVYPLSE